MNSRRPVLTTLCLLIALIAGCRKEDSNPLGGANGQAGMIMPLQVGDQWTYRRTSFDTLGFILQIDTVVVRISGEKWFLPDFWFVSSADRKATEWLCDRPDGLWYMRTDAEGVIVHSPMLLAKYPVHIGDSWVGPDSVTASLSANGVHVSVPKGIYSCLQYYYTENRTGAPYKSMYLSPGVGLVKEEFYNRTLSGRIYIYYQRELKGLTLMQ